MGDSSLLKPGPGGIEQRLEHLPDTPAVYAWHYQFPHLLAALRKGPGEHVYRELLKEVEKPHMLKRTRLISQMGIRVTLSSERGLSKEDLLPKLLASSVQACAELEQVIANCHLWQQPLYVGKARDLQARIKQHLAVGSTLRERLEGVGIALDSCALQYVESSDTIGSAMLEEVAARLFLPPFCKQLG